MARRRGVEPTPGIILIDKPQGWTSHDVVARTRRLAATSAVGHAGTLDPMATGLLVLGIGKATKLLTMVVGHDKTYTATIRLGQATITDDAEGDVTSTTDAAHLSDDALAGAVSALTGDIQQVPSSVSAIKVDGQRSYARVRAGEDVELAARPVSVRRFDITAIRRDGPLIDLDVEVEVSSGTYVRALARDLGAALDVGGHLTALRRTQVGPWDISQAHTLDELGATADNGEPLPLIPIAAAAATIMPSVTLTPADAAAVAYGKRVPASSPHDGPVALLTEHGALAAIAHLRGETYQPAIVLIQPEAQ